MRAAKGLNPKLHANRKLVLLIEIPSNLKIPPGSANWHDNKFIMFEIIKAYIACWSKLQPL